VDIGVLPSTARGRRSGIVDLPPEVRTRLLQLAARSRKTWFGADPARARAVEGAIGFDDTWRVFVNVTADALRGSAGLARRKTAKKDR